MAILRYAPKEPEHQRPAVDVCPYCETFVYSFPDGLVLVGARLFHRQCARDSSPDPQNIDPELFDDPEDYELDFAARQELLAHGEFETYKSMRDKADAESWWFDPDLVARRAAARRQLADRAVDVLRRERVPIRFNTIASIVAEEFPALESTPLRIYWALRRDSRVVDTGSGVFIAAVESDGDRR